MKAREYRKRKGSEIWHWCTNCSGWPKDGESHELRFAKPVNGSYCSECSAMEDNGLCKQR